MSWFNDSSADCLRKLNHAQKVGQLYRSSDAGLTKRGVTFVCDWFVQFAVAVLGECHQEPRLCLRRVQVEHRRLVSVGRGADVHGLLLHE